MTSVSATALVVPPTLTTSLVVELPNSEVVSMLLLLAEVAEVAEIVPASTAARKG